jgi:hypothetical protein
MRMLEAAWSRALPGRQVAERNALLRALKTVSLAALFPASRTTVISPQAKEAILSFVDQFVPPGSEVWLTGSRSRLPCGRPEAS